MRHLIAADKNATEKTESYGLVIQKNVQYIV